MDRRKFLASNLAVGALALGRAQVVAAAAGAAELAPDIRWVQTTSAAPFAVQPAPVLAALPKGFFDHDADIQLGAPAQTIAGFGGAFSEKGWQALALLPEKQRWAALDALFGESGCRFNLCRTPLGADDFSRGWYSYDETDGDFALDHFSIANDRETLIPFLKAAQQVRPDLRLWASPWSPPTWMKRNHHYAMMPGWPGQPSNGLTRAQMGLPGQDWFIQDDRYFDAYARYFARYVGAYREAGIPISTVMPQNEFNSAQPFPSCCWTPEGLGRFLPFLGREMDKLGVSVFFGTLERGDADLVARALARPGAAEVVKGVGVQWAGKDALGNLHRRYPRMEIWGTEQECGVGTNDWHYARYGWSLIKRYFAAGATSWDYWNMVLPTGGMSGWGWPQNSLIVVDPDKRNFRLTPDYWLMRHLSAFVRPGARMVPVTSLAGFDDQLAFRNPDGSLVLVANNALGQHQRVRYGIGGKMLDLLLAADSLNTILIPPSALA